MIIFFHLFKDYCVKAILPLTCEICSEEVQAFVNFFSSKSTKRVEQLLSIEDKLKTKTFLVEFLHFPLSPQPESPQWGVLPSNDRTPSTIKSGEASTT